MKLPANKFSSSVKTCSARGLLKFGELQTGFNHSRLEEKQRGIVAFSSGNHAQAVALAGREAGVRVVVAMPDDAPKMKVAATRDYGAEIIFYDRHKEDREKFALELAERERLVHGASLRRSNDPCRTGNMRSRILEDVPDLDCLLDAM